MTERELLLKEITKAILDSTWFLVPPLSEHEASFVAEAALSVVEAPVDVQTHEYTGICTCGQSGYPENSPHSNHPHYEGCPQYTGR
jgi:hypothetical protein